MDYHVSAPRSQRFTVPYLTSPAAAKRYGALATDDAKKAFVKEAALKYVRSLPTTEDRDGEEWYILVHQSVIWVWDPELGLEYSVRRTTYREEGAPTTETILNRPLRARFIPDGSPRPCIRIA
jgi:hypothetical protein